MNSKEKYLQLISGTKSEALADTEQRIKNRAWMKESSRIALRILIRLDELDWTAKKLANKLQVTPQYVSKLLKGNEKFGFDILVNIQEVLRLPLLYNYEKLDDVKGNVKHENGVIIKVDFCTTQFSQMKISQEAKVISISDLGQEYISLEDIKEN